MTARELLDRWIEALQILAGDDDNPGAEGRERMRTERAQFMARYDAERRTEVLNEAADLIDNDDDCECGGCDTCQPRKLAALLRQHAAPQPDDAPGATQ